MLDLQRWAYGEKKLDDVLSEYGLSIGTKTMFYEQGLKNTRYLAMQEWITEEEAQTILNRIIASIGRDLREVIK